MYLVDGLVDIRVHGGLLAGPQGVNRNHRTGHEGVGQVLCEEAALEVVEDARLVDVVQRGHVGHDGGVEAVQRGRGEVDLLLRCAGAAAKVVHLLGPIKGKRSEIIRNEARFSTIYTFHYEP